MDRSQPFDADAAGATPELRRRVARVLALATPDRRRSHGPAHPKPTMALYAWRRDDPRD